MLVACGIVDSARARRSDTFRVVDVVIVFRLRSQKVKDSTLYGLCALIALVPRRNTRIGYRPRSGSIPAVNRQVIANFKPSQATRQVVRDLVYIYVVKRESPGLAARVGPPPSATSVHLHLLAGAQGEGLHTHLFLYLESTSRQASFGGRVTRQTTRSRRSAPGYVAANVVVAHTQRRACALR